MPPISTTTERVPLRTGSFRTFAPLVLAATLSVTSCAAEDTDVAATATTTQHAGHARLNQLVGEWTAEKSTFVTLIRLESPNRTVMELYFTPPGEPERLADRVVFTRRA